MNRPLVFTGQLTLRGTAQEPPPVSVLQHRVPRVSRYMALAIHFNKLVQQGEVQDFAEVARLGHVTRARVSQIMNLLHLAPDIQEAILFLTRPDAGRFPIQLQDLLPIARTWSWRKQRSLWKNVAVK